MSATNVQPKPNEITVKPRLPYYQINPSYTLRVICCVLFIFLTEICLAHYIYRLINTEIREEYVMKRDFEQNFLNALRTGIGRNEFSRIFKEFVRYESNEQNSSSRSKRNAYVLDDDNIFNIPNDSPHIDFINFKSELDAKGEAERLKTAKKGSSPGDVWLTSQYRIPVEVIQRFCSTTKNYCPPSPPGPVGPPGQKGERGEIGYPGIPGPMGARGYPGLPGEKGNMGRPGLDGRDGVPGEPGFDGMPGRSGLDGIPGENGLPGRNGTNGRDGIDGRPGAPGPQGPPGPQGQKGLTGPRGKAGKPGNHGTPGIPGINAWRTKVNGSELLIPPSIAGNQYSHEMGPVIVEEGDNVKFHCATSGVPKPHVEWRRTDGQPITLGALQAISEPGHTLNIISANRAHMGIYQCIADNGIPPQANQTFILEVHFKPLIRIRNQMVGAYNGSTVVLECEVEAFPESIRYWERADGRLLESGDKYKINNSIEKGGYKSKMQLIITRINRNDFMSYYCIAKNEKDFEPTKGLFTIYEIDPRLATPPPIQNSGVIEYGQRPPPRASIDTICPSPIQCPECIDPKECRDSGVLLFDLIEKWEIRQYGNLTYPGFPNRTTDCVLYAIGKPVYHRFTNQSHGCWMRDANSPEKDSEKYWSTNEGDDHHLLQFDNKSIFRNNVPSRQYNLNTAFRGNAHVVYNGSFYYAARDEARIIKLNLDDESRSGRNVPLLSTNSSNYLYSTGHNYMDFSVDDNGLWVIFGVPESSNTAVMKLDVNSLTIQYIWNISLNHQKVGDMFVVCGVLYAVDSVTDRNSRIRFALDLYKNQLLDVNLAFTNPFRNTTMVGYNHRNKELYTWDRGNQLTYPVRYHEIGYKYSTKDEKHESMESVEAQMHTGFEVQHHSSNG